MTKTIKAIVWLSTAVFFVSFLLALTGEHSFAQSNIPHFLVGEISSTLTNNAIVETTNESGDGFTNDDADSAYQEARILYRHKAYDEAMKVIKEALEIDPENEDFIILRDAIRGAMLPVEESDEDANPEDKASPDKPREKTEPKEPPKRETKPKRPVEPKGKAAKHKPGEIRTANIEGILVRFRWCPPGTFMMGSSKNGGSGGTQHKVTLTKGFWIAETETTQGVWRAIMGEMPGKYEGSNYPVDNVSWDASQEFIRRLNILYAKRGMRFALPTEAQWEYACRAGTSTVFSFGDQLNGDKANCDGESPYGTEKKGPFLNKLTLVGSYAPNAWGIYDMHGNVREWCEDQYDNYPSEDVVDPICTTGARRVYRGGCYYDSAAGCSSSVRGYRLPEFRSLGDGFRLVVIEGGK